MASSEVPKLTAGERFLLHAYTYHEYIDRFSLPNQCSQEGIAEAIGILENHVSREAKKLIEKGLITEKLAHVAGEARRRKVYFLTHTGYLQADEIKRDMEKMMVEYHEAGTVKHISFQEVVSRSKLSFLQVYHIIRQHGFFDPTKTGAGKAVEDNKEGSLAAIDGKGMQDIAGCVLKGGTEAGAGLIEKCKTQDPPLKKSIIVSKDYGTTKGSFPSENHIPRQLEQIILNRIEKKNAKIIVINGEPQCGVSTLLNSMVNHFNQINALKSLKEKATRETTYFVSSIIIKSWDTPFTFLANLTARLPEIVAEGLNTLLSNNRMEVSSSDFPKVAYLLSSSLGKFFSCAGIDTDDSDPMGEKRLVVVIDNADRASPEVARILEIVTDVLAESEKSILLLARKPISFSPACSFTEFKLERISYEEIEKAFSLYSKAEHPTHADIEKILKVSEGKPALIADILFKK
ncbi:MAG: hypothetical protein QW728_04945, partial [Thermoplasmata archaeon]